MTRCGECARLPSRDPGALHLQPGSQKAVAIDLRPWNSQTRPKRNDIHWMNYSKPVMENTTVTKNTRTSLIMNEAKSQNTHTHRLIPKVHSMKKHPVRAGKLDKTVSCHPMSSNFCSCSTSVKILSRSVPFALSFPSGRPATTGRSIWCRSSIV